MVQACLPGTPPDVVDRVVSSADGVPLLVEELLTTSGVPTSLAVSVASRLADLGVADTAVIEAAAVVGREFDWHLLGPATGCAPEAVDRALAAAADMQLLEHDGDQFRFRHALTRDAVLATMAPHRREHLAAAALGAVDNLDPGCVRPETTAGPGPPGR